jgi:hypothetical protein
MNPKIRTDIIDDMTLHYCYICHRQFSHNLSNEPRVQVLGQVEWGKTLYVRPFYSHLNCYQSKEVKRKHTALYLPQIKLVMGVSLRKELKSLKKDYIKIKDPVWKGFTLSTIKEHQRWLKELGR